MVVAPCLNFSFPLSIVPLVFVFLCSVVISGSVSSANLSLSARAASRSSFRSDSEAFQFLLYARLLLLVKSSFSSSLRLRASSFSLSLALFFSSLGCFFRILLICSIAFLFLSGGGNLLTNQNRECTDTACEHHALTAFALPALKSPICRPVSFSYSMIYSSVSVLTAFLSPKTLSGVLVLRGMVPPSFFTSEWQLAWYTLFPILIASSSPSLLFVLFSNLTLHLLRQPPLHPLRPYSPSSSPTCSSSSS